MGFCVCAALLGLQVILSMTWADLSKNRQLRHSRFLIYCHHIFYLACLHLIYSMELLAIPQKSVFHAVSRPLMKEGFEVLDLM